MHNVGDIINVMSTLVCVERLMVKQVGKENHFICETTIKNNVKRIYYTVKCCFFSILLV